VVQSKKKSDSYIGELLRKTEMVGTNDLYSFDPTTLSWTKEITSGEVLPTEIALHKCILYDSKMYVFGGVGRDSIYYLDLITLNWYKIKTPFTKRNLFSAVRIEDFVYIYGGNEYGKKELEIFDLLREDWIDPKIHGRVPGFIRGPCAFPIQSKMYIYGGKRETSLRTDELFIFDTNPDEYKESNLELEIRSKPEEFETKQNLLDIDLRQKIKNLILRTSECLDYQLTGTTSEGHKTEELNLLLKKSTW